MKTLIDLFFAFEFISLKYESHLPAESIKKVSSLVEESTFAVVYDSIQELFKIVYAQEKKVTASIYNLLSISKEENDHATTLFLQWYVAEQREEEAQVRTIMDKIKLIGTGPQSLFFIDQELEKINAERGQEEGAEETAAF